MHLGHLPSMSVLLVLLGTVVALVALLVAGDLRTGGGLRRDLRAHASSPGRERERVPIVEMVGTTPGGAPTTIDLAGGGRPTLLAFLGSTCVSCHDLWRGADRADREGRRDLRVVVVTRGPGAESARRVAKHAPRLVPVVMSDDAWNAYGIGVAPAFVLVDGRGSIGTRLTAAPTWPEVLRTARSALTTGDAS